MASTLKFINCPTYKKAVNVFAARRSGNVHVGFVSPYRGQYRFSSHGNLAGVDNGLTADEMRGICQFVDSKNESVGVAL